MKNVGLVGLGFIGKAHFNAYQHIPNAEVTAICTRSEVTDPEIVNNFHGLLIQNFDELLKNESIDIIDICLPTYLHEEYIVKAAEAGKHIICEKPLTLTEESTERIISVANENDVELFVGHLLRFWPEYELIKSYKETDQLNGLDIVHAKRLGQFPAWSDWFKYPEKSGGALFDLHIHDIDFAYYLLGEVESVYAVGSQNEQGAWTQIMTTLVFKNKTKAFIEASNQMPDGYPFTMNFRAQAKDATLEFAVSAGENIEGIDENNSSLNFYKDQSNQSLNVPLSDPFQKELAYFVSCLEENSENKIIPVSDVRYVMKLLQSIKSSLETGQVIEIS
ncbi:Gfo/Idh/MocA family protein [Halalkalibacillus halophilus]|uniref:Gfo/Idh/MocA family protein n=1 Tax=Halalkalibacillus halophilus TaxID=392827 RepID=UPI00041AFBC4|nr:Gfo/Idh/MocA family oxidoreductase [Halalkalibacillus halophilus]